MADIQLQHESIDQAYTDLLQAAHTMESNLNELVQRLTPLREEFQGAAGTAFEEFFKVVQGNEGQMHEDIHQGAQILDQMNHTMKYADQAAAQGF
ncbi:WXG100 family type VII secretion target [Kitasatospora sp. NPDC008050]|uniref:WXG100 family type VII secretion target n=1 Tax=unclassified Kitasatospora TaxID=2633591 RepID=UPI002E134A45|nr:MULTISPECIES: WXG100 family type VII secretion target [unclassified Kitasatospora]WSJ66827.1 WXG100 family type VII secretion target [Kitasatospora sp. NBC_01302]